MKRWMAWSGLMWIFPVWAMGLGEVQIVDQRGGRELPVIRHDGRLYVAGTAGEEFGVSIRNRSPGDLLAVVSVDGVNVITGETAAPTQSGYVIAAGQSIEVNGWRKAMDRVASFFFTEHDHAYATRTGRPHNTGVIGVALFRRKFVVAEPEAEIGLNQLLRGDSRAERNAAKDSSSSQAPATAEAQAGKLEQKSLGAGHGRNQTSYARQVSFERESESPNEIITIFYDSYNNLVARGVIAPKIAPQPEPQPFPARFVPDPPL